MSGSTVPALAQARFEEPNFYLDDPERVYQELRRQDPVHWYGDGEFYVVTSYELIKHVSDHPEIFSSRNIFIQPDGMVSDPESAQGLADLRASGMTDKDIRGVVGDMMAGADVLIMTDPPRHRLLRRLISKAFTPRVINGLVERIEEITAEALDVPAGTEVDIVETLSVPVTLYMIAELLGVPTDRRADFRSWSDGIINGTGSKDPAALAHAKASAEAMQAYFADAFEQRAQTPSDDLLGLLMKAEVDGETLSRDMMVMLSNIILLAGNETTRNLISGGIWALSQFPEEKAKLVADPDLVNRGAIDELLRWVAPVVGFGRTVVQPTTLGDKSLEPGDFLWMIYAAANRDETVWDGADRLDLDRAFDSMHVAFGFGEHHCLGSNLARMEARIVFRQLVEKFPDFEVVEPPVRVPSSLVENYYSMRVVLK